MNNSNKQKVEEARGRIYDEWMEDICNGPGLRSENIRPLYEDARTMAMEVDRLQKIIDMHWLKNK